MSETTEYHGKCQCGNVQVVAKGKPLVVCYCHCSICRRVAAAPFNIGAVFSKGSVTITGDTVSYATSEALTRLFCKTCFCAVGCRVPDVDVFLPTLMGTVPDELQGTFHCYYGDRIMDVKDGKPKFKAGSKGERIPE